MSPRYFISHSRRDKALAEQLRARLRDGAWVDLYEIEVGDIILEEIAQGIEQASDFVLLWSSASAQSSFVRFEFHLAFVRWLEDKAMSLRIVVLDSTAVPLYLRPFLQMRSADLNEIVLALQGPPPRISRTRAFFNRNSEIEAIESALYSSTKLAIWLWGIPGVGKRTLAEEALRRFSTSQEQVRKITLRPGTREVELHLMITAALATEALREDATREKVSEDSFELLEDFTRAGGTWLFEESQHWLSDDASLGSVGQGVLRALEAAGGRGSGRLAVFTSTRRPHLPGSFQTYVDVVRISGLKPDYAVALLRARGANASQIELETVADELAGHPLALEIAAQQLPQHARDFEEHRVRLATELMGSTRLTDDTWKVLETFAAIDGPLPGQQVADHLGLDSEQYGEAIKEASSYGLLEQGDLGYPALHPLVKDFYLRSFRRAETAQDRLNSLADLAKAFFQQIPPGSLLYVSALLSTYRLLGLSTRLDEARSLRHGLSGTILETASQLYQEQQYELAQHYLDEVLASSPDDDEAILLKARCLAYLDKIAEARALVDQLRDARPVTAWMLRVRGRIEYIARNWQEAIHWYEEGLKRRAYPALLRDLAQAKIRVEDWSGARAAIEKALELGGSEPFALNLYHQILEHDGELDKAREAMERAVRQDPRNSGLWHRLGRIAELQGDRFGARRCYEESLRCDARNEQALLSLASVAADMGDFVTALACVARAEQLPSVRRSVLLNLKAKVSLKQGNALEAKNLVDQAVRIDRERENLGLAIRVRLQLMTKKSGNVESLFEELKLLASELTSNGYQEEAEALVREAEVLL